MRRTLFKTHATISNTGSSPVPFRVSRLPMPSSHIRASIKSINANAEQTNSAQLVGTGSTARPLEPAFFVVNLLV